MEIRQISVPGFGLISLRDIELEGVSLMGGERERLLGFALHRHLVKSGMPLKDDGVTRQNWGSTDRRDACRIWGVKTESTDGSEQRHPSSVPSGIASAIAVAAMSLLKAAYTEEWSRQNRRPWPCASYPQQGAGT